MLSSKKIKVVVSSAVSILILTVGLLSARQLVQENQELRSQADWQDPVTLFSDSFEGGLSSQWSSYNPNNICQIRVQTPAEYGQYNTPPSPDGGNNLLVYRPQEATTDCYIQKNVTGFNTGIVRLYFYDNLTNPQNIIVALKENVDANGDSIWLGMHTVQNAQEYMYQVNGQIVSTGIKRKSGWHKLEFFFQSGYTYASIDDYSLRFNQVATNLTAIRAVKIAAGWNTVSASRYDGIRIENFNAANFRTVEDRARLHYMTDPAAADALVAAYLGPTLVYSSASGLAYWSDFPATTSLGHLGQHLQRIKLLSWNALDANDANDAYKYDIVEAALRYASQNYPSEANLEDSPFTSFVIPDSLSKIVLTAQGKIDPEMILWATQKAGNRANDLDIEGNGNNPFLWGMNGIWRANARFLYGLASRELPHLEYGVSEYNRRVIIENIYVDPNNPDKRIPGRGIMWDYAYLYHGSQLNFGGYGRNAGLEVKRMHDLTVNTDFSINSDKVTIANNYIAQGLSWSVFKGYLDPSVSNHFAMQKNFESTVDATRFNLSTPTGFKHFPSADYSVRRTNNWFVSVRNHSTRILNSEGYSSMNPYCWHQSDGRMYISLTGNEYWQGNRRITNWFSRLPGTIVEQFERTPGDPNYCSSINPDYSTYHGYGSSQFVGGAGNGTYGVSVSDFKATSSCVTAKRSWYFFDEEVVALGSNINCASSNPVNTFINQVPATQTNVNVNGVNYPATTWQTYNSNWAWYDNIGYFFPVTTSLIVQHRNQTRSWSEVHSSNAGDTTLQNDNFLHLYLSHGSNPSQASYAYAVVPGKSLTQMASFAGSNPVTIVKQDSSAHAVEDKSSNTLGMIFWVSGVNVNGYTSNSPAIVLSQKTSSTSLKLTFSDPSQATKTVTVTIPYILQANSLPSQIRIASTTANSTQVTVSVEKGNSYTGTFSIIQPSPTPTKTPTPTRTPTPTQPPSSPTPIIGDINGSGRVDFQDQNRFLQFFDSLINNSIADLDHDGNVDSIDYGILLNHFGL